MEHLNINILEAQMIMNAFIPSQFHVLWLFGYFTIKSRTYLGFKGGNLINNDI